MLFPVACRRYGSAFVVSGMRVRAATTAATSAAKNLPRVDPLDPALKRKNMALGASLAGFVTGVFFLTMHRMNVNTEEELGEDFYAAPSETTKK